MRCFVRCFMLGGSGTTTFQGGQVLFMSIRKCLLEFINIPTNRTITCLASDSDSSLIFRFVLSFTKSITELSFPVSFLSFLLVENGNLLLVVNIGNKKTWWKHQVLLLASTASEHCTAETPAAVPNLNQSAVWKTTPGVLGWDNCWANTQWMEG